MSKSNLNKNRTSLKLKEALEGVNNEIEKSKAGAPALDSENQLQFIAKKLREMFEILDNIEDVKRGYEIPGLWRIVTDTWPFTSPLRKVIVEAELDFEKILKKNVHKEKANKKGIG